MILKMDEVNRLWKFVLADPMVLAFGLEPQVVVGVR
jgi:hypothetical protein